MLFKSVCPGRNPIAPFLVSPMWTISLQSQSLNSPVSWLAHKINTFFFFFFFGKPKPDSTIPYGLVLSTRVPRTSFSFFLSLSLLLSPCASPAQTLPPLFRLHGAQPLCSFAPLSSPSKPPHLILESRTPPQDLPSWKNTFLACYLVSEPVNLAVPLYIKADPILITLKQFPGLKQRFPSLSSPSSSSNLPYRKSQIATLNTGFCSILP